MGTRVESAPCWHLVCDVCGEEPETGDGGHLHFASQQEAESTAGDYEWHGHEGFWACESCTDGVINDVPCPKCNAAVDAECIRTADQHEQWFYGPHHERVDAAIEKLRPVPLNRSSLSKAERQRRRRAVSQRNAHERTWRARDEAIRARGGKVADLYALVRRAEQMSTGARDTLTNRDAKADLDSAVIDLMEAAAKLHRAAMLG